MNRKRVSRLLSACCLGMEDSSTSGRVGKLATLRRRQQRVRQKLRVALGRGGNRDLDRGMGVGPLIWQLRPLPRLDQWLLFCPGRGLRWKLKLPCQCQLGRQSTRRQRRWSYIQILWWPLMNKGPRDFYISRNDSYITFGVVIYLIRYLFRWSTLSSMGMIFLR